MLRDYVSEKKNVCGFCAVELKCHGILDFDVNINKPSVNVIIASFTVDYETSKLSAELKLTTWNLVFDKNLCLLTSNRHLIKLQLMSWNDDKCQCYVWNMPITTKFVQPK